MEGYVLRTKLAEKPTVLLFYNGTADNSDIPFALNTIVAFIEADATVLDRESAIRLSTQLNYDREVLLSKGYLEFEIIMKGLSQFEEASRYAVDNLDKAKMYEALGVMYENNCPLYMVGNGVINSIRKSMNEWGKEHGMEDFWWESEGDEDAILYKGYDILEKEGKIPPSSESGF